MRIYLVSSRNGELVGFRSHADANWTAHGTHEPVDGRPTLGESFREMNDKNKNFPVIDIELTDEQVKALRIPTTPLPRQYVRG